MYIITIYSTRTSDGLEKNNRYDSRSPRNDDDPAYYSSRRNVKFYLTWGHIGVPHFWHTKTGQGSVLLLLNGARYLPERTPYDQIPLQCLSSSPAPNIRWCHGLLNKKENFFVLCISLLLNPQPDLCIQERREQTTREKWETRQSISSRGNHAFQNSQPRNATFSSSNPISPPANSPEPSKSTSGSRLKPNSSSSTPQISP